MLREIERPSLQLASKSDPRRQRWSNGEHL